MPKRATNAALKSAAKAVTVPAPEPNTLQLPQKAGRPRALVLAEAAMDGVSANAVTAVNFSRGTFGGDVGVTELVAELRRQTSRVQANDLTQFDAMLFGQATALASIFHECARRSAMNMGTQPDAMERYMRLALKAQSQCRTTLETLAEIKNPRAVAFVRQANIANGPQQVNNGEAALPRAEVVESVPNKLLEATNVTRLDTRTQSGAIRSHPPLEAVERVHGAKVARRQSAG